MALPLGKRLRPAAARGRRRADQPPGRGRRSAPSRRGQRARLHQPHAARRAGSPARPRRCSATPGWASPPVTGPADGGGGVLLAERGQGDARRPPADHDRRRRASPGCWSFARAPSDPGQPRRRLGHAVRHADRAPGRRRRGLGRGGAARAPTRTPSTRRPARSSTPTRRSPSGRRQRVVHLQGGDPDTMRLWQELVDLSKAYLHRVYSRARRDAHRRRHPRRELLQRHARRHCGRAGGKGPGRAQRRRALRVPARLHRPRRRAAAGHHPQERRRLQLLHHRPGDDPVPGRQARTSTGRSTWSARDQALHFRWSSRSPGRRAGSPTAYRSSTPRSATSSARTASGCGPGRATVKLSDLLAGGRRARRRHPGRGDAATPSSIRTSATRSPRRSASARSSTPTCRPRGTASTSSTGTG